MIYIIIIILVILIGIYLYYTSNEVIPPDTQPLPTKNGLPLIGVLSNVKPSMNVYFNELQKELGPIYQVKLGIRKALVLNDIKWFKKCFKENGDVFSGRYIGSIVQYISHNAGILFTDGKIWANSRSFAMRVLKDYGLGKSISVDMVKAESNFLIENLSNFTEGATVNFRDVIPFHTMNIITKFIMNKRFENNDPRLDSIKGLLGRVTKLSEPWQLLELLYPFLENWEWFKKLSVYMFKDTKTFEKVHDIFRQEGKLHEKQLEQKSEPEDLMDRFIIEQKKFSWENIPPEFSEWQLIRLSFELYIAGYETTSNTLVWALLFMAYRPEVQEKVYEEICEKIGVERMPDMNDKKDMPYTQAVMDEILRLSTVAPLAIFHRTLNSCVIDDYYIPKNILTVANIYACHRDRKVWKKPNAFYPEHFLTEDGLYRSREELVPFGMGKRQCLGESLARVEIFIFFVHIFQKFRVELPKQISEQEFNDCLLCDDGFIRFSSISEFKFIKR